MTMRILSIVMLSIFGVSVFLIVLFVPLILLAWGLIKIVGCDPGFSILLAMGVGVLWSLLLPLIFD